MKHYLGLIVFFLAFVSVPAFSQQVPHIDSYIYPAEIKKGLERLHPLRNYIEIPEAHVTLRIPGTFYFLDKTDSNWVLEKAWGAGSDPAVLGMIFPSKYNPAEPRTWGAMVFYAETGYVPSSALKEVDKDELYRILEKSFEENNSARAEKGLGRNTFLGWAEEPYYYEPTNRFYYAIRLRGYNVSEVLINYNVLIPGREGFLLFTFFGREATFSEMKANYKQIMALAHFEEGYRYEDATYSDLRLTGNLTTILANRQFVNPKTQITVFLLLLIPVVLIAMIFFFRRMRRKMTSDEIEQSSFIE